MFYKHIWDEKLLRNNSLIILASKYEGPSYKEMDVFHYRKGLLDSLRDDGYRVFLGFAGVFAVDDLITSSTEHIEIGFEDLETIENAIKRTKLPKDQRRH